MTTNPSTFDPLQSKTICSNSDSLAMDFQTPHRFQMRENKFFNSSCEEPNEIKSLSATNQLNDQISPTDLKYIQHMAEISEKLDVMKRKEKLSAKKVLNKSQERGNMPSNYQSEYGVSPNQHYLISSQISKYRTNPNLGEKSSKPQNREFSPFASE